VKSDPKLVIIGLDAATWTLIDPWIAGGRLRNLAKLKRDGVSGRLRSVIPPVTPAAWTSFMTGKNPGKHGVFNFIEHESHGYGFRYGNAASRRSVTVWRLLNQAGFSVGTMNMPFTYPPEPLNGFQISGLDTPSERSEFIYPRSLREELERELGPFRLDIRYLGFMSNYERRDRVVNEIEKLDRQWSQAALYLLDKHPQDVMAFVFMSIDTVQHHFWQYLDSEHFLHDREGAARYGTVVRQVYERLDQTVGSIVSRLPPETTVLIISDHGGGPVSDRTVFLNRYLAQLGLLKYRARRPVRRTLKGFSRFAFQVLRKSLSPRQKIAIARMLPRLRQKFEGAYASLGDVDWSQTQAYCTELLASLPSVSVNLKGVKSCGIVDPARYDALLDFLVGKLRELRDPRTNDPVIKRVYRRNEVFNGPFACEGPDLVLDWWSEDSLFETAPSFPDELDQPPIIISQPSASTSSEWGGTHRLDGIFILSGPMLKRNVIIENAQLIDLAPTILHLLGAAVPDDMDGGVLQHAIEPAFLASRPIKKRAATSDISTGDETTGSYTNEEAAKVEDRLQALGYLD